MFREWYLDNESCCYFCKAGYETINHFLGTCEKLKGLWVILQEVHACVFGIDFDYEYIQEEKFLHRSNKSFDKS